MESWQDQAIVLKARAHGENGAVVSLLTEENGRHAGYVRGANSSKMRGVLQIGNLVGANWSSRTADQLGSFKLEQERLLTSAVWDDRIRLAALMSACALCDSALPEREGHAGLFHGLKTLLENMDDENWAVTYLFWEIALLRELGFALDFTKCAATNATEDLIYLSPQSGRAVSRNAGEAYKDKLLPLPVFLRPDKGDVNDEEILKGLKITAHFFTHQVFAHHSAGIPQERLHFQELFGKTVQREEIESSKTA